MDDVGRAGTEDMVGAALGVSDVLNLSGDHPSFGNHAGAFGPRWRRTGGSTEGRP